MIQFLGIIAVFFGLTYVITRFSGMKWLTHLRGDLTKSQSIVLGSIGIGLFILLWFALTWGENPYLKPATLANPLKVLKAYGVMLHENNLITNTTKSIGLNLSGYVIALLLSIPLGFAIGLLPVFKGMFQRFIDAIRFVPLTATIGLFISWYGIGTGMKSYFLAFGIFIFLLPVVVQRINEVSDVYLRTVYTLGATNWQTVRTVYFPAVMSKLWDDLRIMTAISWTYIVFIEVINSEEGGLGSLVYITRRFSATDKKFALLILFILIGVIQDRIFVNMDRKLFPHKYQVKQNHKKSGQQETSAWDSVFDYFWVSITYVVLGLYIVFAVDEWLGILGGMNIIEFLFGGTSWVIHLIMWSLIGVTVFRLMNKKQGTYGTV